MFDTSLVRSQAIGGRRKATLLTVSLAIHSAAVIAAITASIASISFPRTAPNQREIYTPVMPPTLPPLPLGHPAPAQPKPAPPKPAEPVPVMNEAPVPSLAPTSSSESTSTSTETAGTTGGPVGVENGDLNGIDIGQGVSTGTGPATGTAPVTYVPGGEVTTARVLRRVEPRYPPGLLRARIPAIVIVRCIIDREGKIREPEIVHSSYPPFNDAVMDAIRQWTFAPGRMRGQPVDTWFELTVKFEVR